MKRTDYLKIIHKYIAPDSKTYPFFMIHSMAVTKKALEIGRNLKLNENSLRFIEEASMLHDIGIIRVDDPDMDCKGDKPYLCHMLEGEKILKKEGLPKHARVARSHTGVGVFQEDITENNLPLPVDNYCAETIEEKVISYADLFFSKVEEILWYEKDLDQIRKEIGRFGDRHANILEKWIKEFS